MADTAFGSEACFSLDGKTRYYINLKNQEVYDGTQIANLTQEDVSILDFLVREGNPTNAATHQLTGTMIEWSKALQYILLEVTQADQADLVGKKIKVSTRYRTGSIPVIGTPVQVGYDGTVYAIWQSMSTTTNNAVVRPMLDVNAPMYDILGRKVDNTYRGIILQNGNKYLLR